jgi:fatty-acyl-CoA synthase
MAGSLCPSELMRKVQTEMHLVEMEIGYGMTETSPLALKPDTMRHLTKELVQWVVLPHTEIKSFIQVQIKLFP